MEIFVVHPPSSRHRFELTWSCSVLDSTHSNCFGESMRGALRKGVEQGGESYGTRPQCINNSSRIGNVTRTQRFGYGLGWPCADDRGGFKHRGRSLRKKSAFRFEVFTSGCLHYLTCACFNKNVWIVVFSCWWFSFGGAFLLMFWFQKFFPMPGFWVKHVNVCATGFNVSC